MNWSAYVATLAEAEHRRLLIALGAGLREARLASEVATLDGRIEDARRHVAVAVLQLGDVLDLLGPPGG